VTILAQQMRVNIYINDRQPYRDKFIITASTKFGKEELPNRLETQNNLNFDWFKDNICVDAIRINLKKHIGFRL